MNTNQKYNRYMLIEPEGKKIYKSKSQKNVINLCYKEFKKNNINFGDYFTIINLDTQETFTYSIHKKLYNKQITKLECRVNDLEQCVKKLIYKLNKLSSKFNIKE